MILPARIRDGDVVLRPMRMRDCRRFIRLDREAGPAPSAPVIPSRYSWPGLWWWLRRRLFVSYGIEVRGTACGLIGLYDLTSGSSAHVALALFDRSARGKGIGSKAFAMLAGMLMLHPVAALLFVDVRSGDDAALRFWLKQGFVQTAADMRGNVVLTRDMRHGNRISPRPPAAGQEGYGSRPEGVRTAGSALP